MNELDRYAVSVENMEVLRAQVDEQAREIERLEGALYKERLDADEQRQELDAARLNLASANAALKAQPSGVVLADDIRAACQNAVEVFAEETNAAQCREVAEYMREVLLARLNSSPVSAALTASAPNHSEQVRWPDVDLAMHLLSDRWPESSERIEVEVFAEWLRDLLANAPSAGSQGGDA